MNCICCDKQGWLNSVKQATEISTQPNPRALAATIMYQMSPNIRKPLLMFYPLFWMLPKPFKSREANHFPLWESQQDHHNMHACLCKTKTRTPIYPCLNKIQTQKLDTRTLKKLKQKTKKKYKNKKTTSKRSCRNKRSFKYKQKTKQNIFIRKTQIHTLSYLSIPQVFLFTSLHIHIF